MRCNLSLYTAYTWYTRAIEVSAIATRYLNVSNRLKIKVLSPSFEGFPWAEGTFGPKGVALPGPLAMRTSASGAPDVAVMMTRSGAIVFTICAYLTLLTELGHRRVVGAPGVRPYAGRGAGAWRLFMIQVRYSSLLYWAYLVRGSDVTNLSSVRLQILKRAATWRTQRGVEDASSQLRTQSQHEFGVM